MSLVGVIGVAVAIGLAAIVQVQIQARMVGGVFCMKSLKGKFAMAALGSAASLRNVWVVPAHNLCFHELELGINAFQLGLQLHYVK